MRRVVMVTVLAFLLAACGGSDEPTATTGESTDGADTAATGAADDGANDTAASAELTADDCTQVQAALQTWGTAATAGGTGAGEAAAAFEAAVTKAPAEVADDFQALADAMRAIADDPATAAQAVSGPELTEAVTNITTFVTQECT